MFWNKSANVYKYINLKMIGQIANAIFCIYKIVHVKHTKFYLKS